MFDSATAEVTAQGEVVTVRGQESDWQAAHDALVQLARKRAGLDFEEGRWLLATGIAVRCQAARTQISWTFITFERAKMVAATTPKISSHCVAPTIARATGVSSS